MTEQKSSFFDVLLNFFAIIVPFYMIFYTPMHERHNEPKMKTLRKYVYLGFSAYAVLFLTITIL